MRCPPMRRPCRRARAPAAVPACSSSRPSRASAGRDRTLVVERSCEGRHVMSCAAHVDHASSIIPIAGHAMAATALVLIAVECSAGSINRHCPASISLSQSARAAHRVARPDRSVAASTPIGAGCTRNDRQIPIVCRTVGCPLSRGFLPWRLPDVGPRVRGCVRVGPTSGTLHREPFTGAEKDRFRSSVVRCLRWHTTRRRPAQEQPRRQT